MAQAGVSERDPVTRFNRQNRDYLRELRARVDRKHPYTDFRMRQQMLALRGSYPLRQQVANDRLKLQLQIRDRTLQSAMKAEVDYIEGHRSYMNIPPHMLQRLSELQTQLA